MFIRDIWGRFLLDILSIWGHFSDILLVKIERINIMEKIRIGIYGYGNLGKGVEIAVKSNPDMELKGIFTRREPASLKTVYSDSPVYNLSLIHI